ncbi:MAG: ATP-binding cassette domain-containing protein [Collinsella sp.]
MFDHMSFRFDDADEDTLCDLSFACRRGQTTAIVGSTGSGKSTVAKLLLRFHDASKGAIRLDGVDLRDLSQVDIRGHIAYVPQKAWLFSGTVASNLRLATRMRPRPTCSRAGVAQSTLCSISRRDSIPRWRRAVRTLGRSAPAPGIARAHEAR